MSYLKGQTSYVFIAVEMSNIMLNFFILLLRKNLHFSVELILTYRGKVLNQEDRKKLNTLIVVILFLTSDPLHDWMVSKLIWSKTERRY